jgi:small subunit ribosomal protein S19
MSRSSKKGPYIDPRVLSKVLKQKQSGDKSPIKTWSRSCVISPDFVGHTFLIHQGKNFIEVFCNESMVGHKLGEFAPTRTFRGHGKIVKRILAKT